jgi:outer membrane immunogenic protein
MTNTFLRAALGCVALVAVSGAAEAADMYRKAPVAAPIEAVSPVSIYNWSGFYAGANLGGEFLRDTGTNAGISRKLNGTSVFGGVQAGYNFQSGPWVYGLEADIGYGRPSKTKAFGANTMKIEEGVSGTARVRAGYAVDRALVYGTGGLAWANFDTTVSNGVLTEKADRTRAGWVVGGGVEYAVTNNVSVKGEYLYENFGKMDKAFASVGATRNELSDHIVRAGVNYKF